MSKQSPILVVDDNIVNRSVLHAYLTKHGHKVDIAHNGYEAVAAVRANNYALILMDVQMPIKDGIQATKEIRKLPEPKRLVPIIAISADTTGEHVHNFKDCGFNNQLPKPIDFEELARYIELYKIEPIM